MFSDHIGLNRLAFFWVRDTFPEVRTPNVPDLFRCRLRQPLPVGRSGAILDRIVIRPAR